MAVAAVGFTSAGAVNRTRVRYRFKTFMGESWIQTSNLVGKPRFQGSAPLRRACKRCARCRLRPPSGTLPPQITRSSQHIASARRTHLCRCSRTG